MAKTIKESRYILSDVEVNNNKFWNIVFYDDNTVVTQWGRVGETGQSKTFSHNSNYEAERFYNSKCREKEKKGYNKSKILTDKVDVKPVNSSQLVEVAKKQIQTNSPLVLDLIKYLSKVNVHHIVNSTTMSYDSSKGTFSTPLGIVTKEAIDEARSLLTEIGNFVKRNDYGNPSFIKRVNLYLMRVPQDIGRGKPDLKVLYPDLKSVQKQNSILDALEASLQTVVSSSGENPLEDKIFEVKLNHVENGKTIDSIRKMYKSTAKSGHECSHLNVDTVYEVEIAKMARDFTEGKKVGNVNTFWHGTRCSNVLSILKSGLVIPPKGLPHVTGRLFGDGLYFAPSSTKSLNYSYGYWDGRARDSECYMFLADVAMGKAYVPGTYGHSGDYPVRGYDSTWAKGGISNVVNDECIVYNTKQACLKYLIKFTSKG